MTLEYSHRNRGIIPGSTAPLAGLTPRMIQQLQQMISDGSTPEWLVGETEVELTEGGQWDISIDVVGEKATFRITVPPGGEAWSRGAVANGTDYNTLTTPGAYRVLSGTGAINHPLGVDTAFAAAGTLEVFAAAGTSIVQRFTSAQTGLEVERTRVGGVWSSWLTTNFSATAAGGLGTAMRYMGALPSGTDLDTLRDYKHTGYYRLTPGFEFPNRPPGVVSGILIVHAIGSPAAIDTRQEIIWNRGYGWYVRYTWDATTWVDWRRMDGSSDGGDEVAGPVEDRLALIEATAPLETRFEGVGEWSPRGQRHAFMDRFGRIPGVAVSSIGKSVDGNDIQAAVIGDLAKPSVLVVAGHHGTEPGASESALIWARDFAANPGTALDSISVIVIPTINPDRLLISRDNANGVNLNRDWIDATQPEMQAIKSFLAGKTILAAIDLHGGGYYDQLSLVGPSMGDPAAIALAGDLYDAVFAAAVAAGEPVRAYPELTEPGMSANAWAADGIPGVLIEIQNENLPPEQGQFGGWYYPDPAWQVSLGKLSTQAFIEYVVANLPDFL